MIRNRTLSLHFYVKNPFCDVHVRGLLRETKKKRFYVRNHSSCQSSVRKVFCVEKLFCKKSFCEKSFCVEKLFC